jgi:ketosteroid isomerase-like protein
MGNAERLAGVTAGVVSVEAVAVDDALVDRLIEALRPITAPDVVTVMRGSDEMLMGTYEGLDGLREGWADWLGSFERVTLAIESLEEVGDNVLTLARQVGTTRHGGVEIEQPSAAVWKFRDGRLTRVEFHLDREAAMASAPEQL